MRRQAGAPDPERGAGRPRAGPPHPTRDEDLRPPRRLGQLGCGCGLWSAGITAVVVIVVVGLLAQLGSCDWGIGNTSRYDCARSKTPLVAATTVAGAAKVRTRLAAGDRPDQADADGNRPLACAALVGNDAAVEALLAAGADPNLAGTAGGRPIVAAVSGEGVISGSKSGAQPFMAGPDAPSRVRVVQSLAVYGARLDPALTPAIEAGNLTAVRALVEAGANPNGDPAKPSPLTTLAIDWCGPDHPCGDAGLAMVDLLLRVGADPDQGGHIDGATARMVITFSGHSLEEGELARMGDGVGTVPPLVAAALTRNHPVLERLLAAGADPNLPAFDVYGPLWAAVEAHDIEGALRLIAAGAHPVPPDPQFEDPVATARRTHQPKLAALLVEAARNGH